MLAGLFSSLAGGAGGGTAAAAGAGTAAAGSGAAAGGGLMSSLGSMGSTLAPMLLQSLLGRGAAAPPSIQSPPMQSPPPALDFLSSLAPRQNSASDRVMEEAIRRLLTNQG